MSSLRDLVGALKHRALVQWLLAYLATAGLLLQLVSILADQFNWPATVSRGFTVLLGAGLLAMLIIGWYHGEKGRQQVSAVEILMLGGVAVLAGAALQLV